MKLGYAEPGATVKGTVGSFGAKRLFSPTTRKDASDETFAAGEASLLHRRLRSRTARAPRVDDRAG
ncbi:MAG: hypothetical protein KIS78_23770 [Labilithrix sp.]|nr:hypothetical protein [Labilithrix sp.]